MQCSRAKMLAAAGMVLLAMLSSVASARPMMTTEPSSVMPDQAAPGGRRLSQANVWLPGIVRVKVDEQGNTDVGLGPGGLFKISGRVPKDPSDPVTVGPSSVYALPSLGSILGTSSADSSSNDGSLLGRLINSDNGSKSLADATDAITGRASSSGSSSSPSSSPSPSPAPAAKSFAGAIGSIGSGGLLSRLFGGGRRLSQANVWIPGIVNVKVDDKGNTNVGLGPGGLFKISGKAPKQTPTPTPAPTPTPSTQQAKAQPSPATAPTPKTSNAAPSPKPATDSIAKAFAGITGRNSSASSSNSTATAMPRASAPVTEPAPSTTQAAPKPVTVPAPVPAAAAPGFNAAGAIVDANTAVQKVLEAQQAAAAALTSATLATLPAGTQVMLPQLPAASSGRK